MLFHEFYQGQKKYNSKVNKIFCSKSVNIRIANFFVSFTTNNND